MKYVVEIVRGVNKGRILSLDEEKAEEFVKMERVKILKVITADAPPEETENFMQLNAEPEPEPVVEVVEEEPVFTPPAEGEDLEEEERCIAVTKSGSRCKHSKASGEYCGVHASKEE